MPTVRGITGMKRFFPIGRDVRRSVGGYNPAGPYVPQAQESPMITVARNGTGDFEDIQKALNSLPSTGGSVHVREGTYELTASLVIPSNTILLGDGMGTILVARAVGVPDDLINLSGKTNVKIMDLKFEFYFGDAGYIINTDNSDGIIFDKIIFKPKVDINNEVFLLYGSTPAVRLRLLNCIYDDSEGEIRYCCGSINKAQIEGNRFDGMAFAFIDADFTNCIITQNFFSSIDMTAGDNNNIVTSNQTDTVITNVGTGNQVANNVVF